LLFSVAKFVFFKILLLEKKPVLDGPCNESNITFWKDVWVISLKWRRIRTNTFLILLVRKLFHNRGMCNGNLKSGRILGRDPVTLNLK